MTREQMEALLKYISAAIDDAIGRYDDLKTNSYGGGYQEVHKIRNDLLKMFPSIPSKEELSGSYGITPRSYILSGSD